MAAVLLGLAYYFLTQELFITYVAPEVKESIEFKRSLIEGQNIDEHAGERIVAIIEMLVLGHDKPRALGAGNGGPGGVKEALGRASEELSVVAQRTRERADTIAAQAKDIGERAVAKVSPMLEAAGTKTLEANVIPMKCPGCGVSVSAENAFCNECGRKLR
ncbi:MAG: hypothetical protein IPN64_06700 [Propionivibrio sp.]|uniref:hypothetical protein n=1 Tax=Propionivibrio sp. TaxID=2212460 RepID=UPI0025CEC9FF|nr:hypothetical protein [Propionivibrio sp.]MBK8893740.1 hypothetical protein [Propionivibrio sp.]